MGGHRRPALMIDGACDESVCSGPAAEKEGACKRQRATTISRAGRLRVDEDESGSLSVASTLRLSREGEGTEGSQRVGVLVAHDPAAWLGCSSSRVAPNLESCGQIAEAERLHCRSLWRHALGDQAQRSRTERVQAAGRG